MRKVNLFIVGAARSGTTSLWKYLNLHHHIFMPEDDLGKEPTYFSNSGKKRKLSEYHALFEKAAENHRWIVDASVAYLTDSESAKKIYQYNPNARIIILLRNPADRAYSLYKWMVGDGYEYIPSFEEALEQEEMRSFQKKSNWFRPNYYWGYLYYASGLYHDQVKRYIDLFHTNVLTVKFEDLIGDPVINLKKIFSFLELEPARYPFGIHNPSRTVLSSKIQFILRKLNQYIIRSNSNGIELKRIAPSIVEKHTEYINKLSQVTTLSVYEKFVGRRIIKKISYFLANQDNPFPYNNINRKTVRDQLLQYGYKKKHPPKLKKRTRNLLLDKYHPELKKINNLTGIDYTFQR